MQKSAVMQDAIFIFFAALIIFAVNLPLEFIEFQTRFALFAKYMLHDGVTFFAKTYQGFYPDYPVTSTILIYICAKIFGKLTPFTAILPTAITSALILVMIYKIGALQKRKLGLTAVLFALLTQVFLSYSRSISLDQYISLFTVICFYAAYKNFCENKNKFSFIIPLMLVCGFSFRGLLGVVIPSAVLFCFYFYTKNYKNLVKLILTTILLSVLLNTILLLFAYIHGGINFAKNIIFMQVIGRVQPNYFTNFIYCFIEIFIVYALSYPIAFSAFLNNFRSIKNPCSKADYLLGALTLWVFIILLIFTLVGTVKERYILAIIPAISLLSAYMFININNRFSLFVKKITLFLMFVITALSFSLLTLKLTIYKISKYFFPTTAFDIILGFLAFLLLISFVLIFYFKKIRKDFYLLSLGTAAFIIINIGIIEPFEFYKESSKIFIQQVISLKKNQNHKFVFYQIGPDGLDITFAANYPKLIKPDFVTDEKTLLIYDKATYFVAKKANFDIISENVKEKIQTLFTGNLGHVQCVVFTLK